MDIPINRRSFLCMASASVLASSVAHAEVFMPFAPATGRAFVPHAEFVAQQCNDWCWAASCSMIFGTLGHPTDQKKLVDFLYSDMACAPAPQTRDLTQFSTIAGSTIAACRSARGSKRPSTRRTASAPSTTP